MKKLVFYAIFLTTVLFISCDKDDDDDVPATKNLILNIQGLENLGANYVYEGWLLINGSPITSGRFSVNAAGQLSQSTFAIAATQLDAATAFILTIEPAVNDDPAPSSTHLLAGDFNGSSGNMTVSHAAALGNDYSTAAGKYILATPTDGGIMTNEESGIWFLDNASGSMAPGLTLPTLPAGWKYEGWVVINSVPVSTGTFLSNSAADDNAATSPYKGTANNGPAFPGEDYLRNAPSGLAFPTDLKGKTTVISIEPNPDNSSTPFTLKPLAKAIPANAPVHTTLGMDQNLGSFPKGSFSR